MENLLKEIEKCEFECEAGNLKGCRAWQELKKRIISTEEKGKTHIIPELYFDEKIKLLLSSKTESENKVRIIEELAELQKEIAKDLRNHLTPETRVIDCKNILEEFADVVIELHMLKEIYNISDSELDKAINEKMEKNLNRIGIYRIPSTL